MGAGARLRLAAREIGAQDPAVPRLFAGGFCRARFALAGELRLINRRNLSGAETHPRRRHRPHGVKIGLIVPIAAW